MCLSRNNPRLRASNLYQRPHGDIHCSECLDDCSTSACRLSTRAYELSSGVRDRLEGRVFKGGRRPCHPPHRRPLKVPTDGHQSSPRVATALPRAWPLASPSRDVVHLRGSSSAEIDGADRPIPHEEEPLDM
jgi:hypothetical protein